MGAVQIATSVSSLTTGQRGHIAVSLNDMDGTSVATVMAGSVVEVAGALFEWQTAETPNASSWTAISTGSTVYIQCVPSGSAGSQILTTSYTSTAPAWVDTKHGYYASAGSSTRIVAQLTKDAATEYADKQGYPNRIDTGEDRVARRVRAYISDNTTPTYGSAYTVLSPYVPLIGDMILCNGTFDAMNQIAFVERTGATTIDVHYALSPTGAIATPLVLTSGSATTFSSLILAV